MNNITSWGIRLGSYSFTTLDTALPDLALRDKIHQSAMVVLDLQNNKNSARRENCDSRAW